MGGQSFGSWQARRSRTVVGWIFYKKKKSKLTADDGQSKPGRTRQNRYTRPEGCEVEATTCATLTQLDTRIFERFFFLVSRDDRGQQFLKYLFQKLSLFSLKNLSLLSVVVVPHSPSPLSLISASTHAPDRNRRATARRAIVSTSRSVDIYLIQLLHGMPHDRNDRIWVVLLHIFFFARCASNKSSCDSREKWRH